MSAMMKTVRLASPLQPQDKSCSSYPPPSLDPLRNNDSMQEELEALPFLGRCNYKETSGHMVSLFDPRAQAFQVLRLSVLALRDLFHC